MALNVILTHLAPRPLLHPALILLVPHIDMPPRESFTHRFLAHDLTDLRTGFAGEPNRHGRKHVGFSQRNTDDAFAKEVKDLRSRSVCRKIVDLDCGERHLKTTR